jgi:hypothetical protein
MESNQATHAHKSTQILLYMIIYADLPSSVAVLAPRLVPFSTSLVSQTDH